MNSSYNMKVVWPNVMGWVIAHSFAVYGASFLFHLKKETILFTLVSLWMTSIGVTAGVHRLWSHRSYKATPLLRVFLVFCQTLAGESSIYIWVRDHRTHHKGSDTDADPYNASRGFFFSHMGWLMVRKHPEVLKAGSTVDLKDIIADPFVMFQHRHYIPCAILVCFTTPTLLPFLCWDETFQAAFFINILRYIISLHTVWLVNSAAHIYGNRPYDTNIAPADNILVAFLNIGEGFHNFHHSFPYDYRASEWGNFINPTKFFIDTMAFIGQAYDLKTATDDNINKRTERTGTKKKRNMDSLLRNIGNLKRN